MRLGDRVAFETPFRTIRSGIVVYLGPRFDSALPTHDPLLWFEREDYDSLLSGDGKMHFEGGLVHGVIVRTTRKHRKDKRILPSWYYAPKLDSVWVSDKELTDEHME